MRVVYVINSEKYSYHKLIVQDFVQVIPGEIKDLASSNYTIVDEINNAEYDAIIVFDLVDHVYRTTSDTLSFNKMTARTASILFRRIEEYREAGYRQNLSSFMYISQRDDLEYVRKKYNEVPNIEQFVNIYYKPITDAEHNQNKGNIAIWWDEFKREAMLDETPNI